MKKFILRSVFLALLVTGFLCIPKKEGNVSFAIGNLWTTFRDTDIDGLQYIRFHSRYAPVLNAEKGFPARETWHFTGERWHFGFPCWVFYVDVGTVEEIHTKYSLEPKVWYAKMDLYRTLINGFVGLVAGLGLIGLYHFIRGKGSKKILNFDSACD